MTQPAHAISQSSTPSIHLPDLARAVSLLFGAGVLLNFTALNAHLLLGPIAWVVLVAFVVACVASAARIVMVEAIAPRDPSQRMERTRRTNTLQELIIAGAGSLMFAVPALYSVMSLSQEVWAGRVEESKSFSPIGLAFALFVGVLGYLMVYFRPQFLLDVRAGKITRYAFGRSIPFGVKELPYNIGVYSESLITNYGTHLGEQIRGRVGKYTFELERLAALPPDLVQARARQLAAAIGATYWTAEQAIAAELKK